MSKNYDPHSHLNAVRDKEEAFIHKNIKKHYLNIWTLFIFSLLSPVIFLTYYLLNNHHRNIVTLIALLFFSIILFFALRISQQYSKIKNLKNELKNLYYYKNLHMKEIPEESEDEHE